MKAKYLVKNQYPVAAPVDGTDTIRDKMLKTGCILVMEEGVYTGLLTSQDLVQAPKNLIIDCLKEKPFVDFEQGIDTILTLMKETGFDALPVLKDGIFTGVVLQSDIVAFLSDYNENLQSQICSQTQELHQAKERLEKEIQEREIAEKKNRELTDRIHHAEKVAAIGTLSAGIAHDFNNILTPIIGFTELALLDAEPGSPLADNLNEIFTAGTRAKEIIKQILRYARHSDAVSAPIQISTVLDEGLKLIQSSFPSTISIEQHLETDAFVKADPAMLHQIYMNLCTNAYQAMEETGGRLRIQARKTLFLHDAETIPNGIAPGEYVELIFADDGIGILPQNLPRVFDPYFSTKPPGKGTGLGLSTVFGIVKGYNGTIHIDSRPGQGTRVFVYLPVTKQLSGHQERVQVTVEKGHERILFVDDEEAIIRMNKQGLERAGYQVAVYSDPLQALALFKSDPTAIDLVVTDLTMPHMTGEVFTHELKRIRPDIPVVLCTGCNTMQSAEKMKDAGLAAIVEKPVIFSELSQIIRKILDREQ